MKRIHDVHVRIYRARVALRRIVRSRPIALRMACLASALWLVLMACQAWNAPAEVIRAVDGRPLLINGRPVYREKAWIAQLVWMVVSAIINYALSPKPPKPKPASIDDFDMPQAVQGAPFAMIFGEVEDKSPVVGWYGDLTSKPIKKGKK